MPHLELDDGFRLYYETHGPAIGAEGSATPILFAHGAGGNAMSWWQQVPAFADRYPIITFDHRAFGRSQDIEDGPGRIAFGADVYAQVPDAAAQPLPQDCLSLFRAGCRSRVVTHGETPASAFVGGAFKDVRVDRPGPLGEPGPVDSVAVLGLVNLPGRGQPLPPIAFDPWR